jgi:hypothetical protein
MGEMSKLGWQIGLVNRLIKQPSSDIFPFGSLVLAMRLRITEQGSMF